MAEFNTSHSTLPDAHKPAHSQEMCTVSVQARVASLEKNLSGAASTTRSSHTPKPDCERRSMATPTQNTKPKSLRVQSAETQTDTDSRGSSKPPNPNIVVTKSAVKANTDLSSKTSVSLASTEPAYINYRQLESATTPKPEAQESNVPSFLTVHQSPKRRLPQQNSVTKEPSLTDSDCRVENIININPPKLPESQKTINTRTRGAQMKVQKESTNSSVPEMNLPDLLSLGKPPPKPNRPPRVDIHRFRRIVEASNGGEKFNIFFSLFFPRLLCS